MKAVYLSIAMRDAQSATRCVQLIGDAPIAEGVEGIEFEDWQLAGQWAADYAIDSDAPLEQIDASTMDAFIDIVHEHCQDEQYNEGTPVTFDRSKAHAHAMSIIKARQAGESMPYACL